MMNTNLITSYLNSEYYQALSEEQGLILARSYKVTGNQGCGKHSELLSD